MRIGPDTARLGVAIEVDGELGNAEHRFVDEDEMFAQPAAMAGDHPAGQPEVSVHPGCDEWTAVGIDRDLLPADRADVGVLLHPQVRTVGVGAGDAERRVVGQCCRWHDPRDERPTPDGDVATGRRRPWLRLVDLDEADGGEPVDRTRTRVERGRGRVDECAHVIGERERQIIRQGSVVGGTGVGVGHVTTLPSPTDSLGSVSARRPRRRR